jgi:hypothetical protein
MFGWDVYTGMQGNANRQRQQGVNQARFFWRTGTLGGSTFFHRFYSGQTQHCRSLKPQDCTETKSKKVTWISVTKLEWGPTRSAKTQMKGEIAGGKSELWI